MRRLLGILVLFLITSSAHANGAFVQQVSGESTTASSSAPLNVTVASTGSGNFLFASGRDGAAANAITCSDTHSDSFTGGETDSNGDELFWCYAFSIASGNTTVTFTPASGTAHRLTAGVLEESGVGSSLDKSSTNYTGNMSVTTCAPGSQTTTGTDSLIAVIENDVPQTSGWTNPSTYTNSDANGNGGMANTQRAIMVYKLNVAAGAQNPSWTYSVSGPSACGFFSFANSAGVTAHSMAVGIY